MQLLLAVICYLQAEIGRTPVMPGGLEEYKKIYKWSIEDPDGFWGKVCRPKIIAFIAIIVSASNAKSANTYLAVNYTLTGLDTSTCCTLKIMCISEYTNGGRQLRYFHPGIIWFSLGCNIHETHALQHSHAAALEFGTRETPTPMS